ncbi:MAG: anti-sigma factor [Chthoniobacteraceae bacterium]
MIDERHEELASLYVLNLLEPAELAAFEQELAENPELAELVRELGDSAAALADPLPEIMPPAHLRAAVLVEIDSTPEPKKVIPLVRSSVVAWALAAGFALLAGIETIERLDMYQSYIQYKSKWAAYEELLHENQLLHNQIAELESENQFSQLKIATLGALVDTYSKGSVVVVWDEQKQTGVIKVTNMPAPAADRDYQLWVVDPAYPQPVSAGIFRLETTGIVRTEFHPVKPIHKATTFAISIEQKGGVPEHKGPIIMAGQ